MSITIEIIHKINNVGEFTFICLLAAVLELAFQEYQTHDMIFEWYHNFLKRWYLKKGWRRKLSMLLGYCTLCNGFWVAAIFYILYFKDISLILLLFCGLNYLFIKIFSGIINIIFESND